jgi:hypothetical protein
VNDYHLCPHQRVPAECLVCAPAVAVVRCARCSLSILPGIDEPTVNGDGATVHTECVD